MHRKVIEQAISYQKRVAFLCRGRARRRPTAPRACSRNCAPPNSKLDSAAWRRWLALG
jgi:hypothetical protein